MVSILSTALTTSAAIIQFKDGRKGIISVTDTVSITDTLSCNINIIGKEKTTHSVAKSEIEYIVFETDTLRFDYDFCSRKARTILLQQKLQSSTICSMSLDSGRAAGSRYKSSSAFIGGVVSGAALPLLGLGMAPCIANITTYPPRTIPDSVDVFCYTAGFEEKAKKRAVMSALGGAAVGQGITVLAYGIYLVFFIEASLNSGWFDSP